jgi:hypothetical protein
LFNEVSDNEVHRAQFGPTLSISHRLEKNFGLSGEIWHFTQPFLSSHAVGNLWALNYNPRKNLVFNFGFNRGLTGTSARWEGFAGFTSLLPHRILPPCSANLGRGMKHPRIRDEDVRATWADWAPNSISSSRYSRQNPGPALRNLRQNG